MLLNVMNAQPELRLFTPGPTNIPNRVAVASSYVNYHHRSASFSAIMKDLVVRMRPLFGTAEGLVMPVHTTGRGALEGVYANLLAPGSKVISICNGKFGEMSANIVKKLGLECVRCFGDWKTDIDLDELEQTVKKYGATAITIPHNDTSNGIVNPVWGVGKLARKYGLLLIVDAVSSIGCMPFKFDEWGVDAVVTASQKGLMSPPGLSFVVLSGRAWKAAEATESRASYINFHAIKKELENGQTPGSTPTSLVLAVNEGVNMILEEGLEQVYFRHSVVAQATRRALLSLGYTFYAKCTCPSDSLTVMDMPSGLDSVQLIKHMRVKYGVQMSKGLDDEPQRTLRLAHMGYFKFTDLLDCIVAMEAALCDLGKADKIGVGTTCFMESYNNAVAGSMKV